MTDTFNNSEPLKKFQETLDFGDINDALTVLRTETALSRFPMHRLTKGEVRIELRNQLSAVHWKVTYDSDYGAPGPLAYKVESLYVNRKIEESGRPVPKIIRLGSLREIAGEVNLGHNTAALKTALLQNATSNITAKISYRTREGGEQWLEAVFNRYSIVFTGETLPTGGRADAVYLVLNDIYQQVLNTAVFRPLDYDYMKTLPPISQRFYEIASYQIFGALKLGNPRAKLLYSEYCLLSTATRYFDFDHVKKQMYKVLRPHVRSRYLAKVEYQSFTNEAGEADWMMMLTPGPNAMREYRAFTGKPQLPKKSPLNSEALPLPFPEIEAASKVAALPVLVKPSSVEAAKKMARSRASKIDPQLNPNPQQTLIPEAPLVCSETLPEDKSASAQELVEALVASELNRSDAERFAREKPEVCGRQLAYLPFVESFKTSRGAYLRRAIEGDFGPPPAYARAQAQEAAQTEQKRQRGESAFQAAQEKAREGHQNRFYGVFCGWMTQTIADLEKTHPEAFMAFRREEERLRANLKQGPLAGRPMTLKSLETFDTPIAQTERFLSFVRDIPQSRLTMTLDFWEWDKKHNPDRFSD